MRWSKAEQAADSRLVFDQLTLERLRDLVSFGTELRQLEAGRASCLLEDPCSALQLGEIVGVQDHGLDAVGAIAPDEIRVADLRLRNAYVVALDRNTLQLHGRKVAPLSDGFKRCRTTPVLT